MSDFLIRADSVWSITSISPKRGTYTVEELQRLVEGHFTLLPEKLFGTAASKSHDVWVNEEAALLDMPLNVLASQIVGTELFGPVAFTLKGRVK